MYLFESIGVRPDLFSWISCREATITKMWFRPSRGKDTATERGQDSAV